MGNIILIGFMGSGKSSVGRYMHRKGYAFIDTDSYIEKKEKRKIKEIFATDGEAYFRSCETRALEEIIAEGKDDFVIAVGGGLVMTPANQPLLHKLGKVVYLRATVDTLLSRLKDDSNRPLLQGGTMREKIETLMEQREATYKKVADLVVDTDNRSFEHIYRIIKKHI